MITSYIGKKIGFGLVDGPAMASGHPGKYQIILYKMLGLVWKDGWLMLELASLYIGAMGDYVYIPLRN